MKLRELLKSASIDLITKDIKGKNLVEVKQWKKEVGRLKGEESKLYRKEFKKSYSLQPHRIEAGKKERKIYYSKNREELLKKDKIRRERPEIRQQKLLRSKIYYNNNKDKVLNKMKQYREKPEIKEKRSELARRYYERPEIRKRIIKKNSSYTRARYRNKQISNLEQGKIGQIQATGKGRSLKNGHILVKGRSGGDLIVPKESVKGKLEFTKISKPTGIFEKTIKKARFRGGGFRMPFKGIMNRRWWSILE